VAIKYKFLYVNGDSYSAGAGLVYHKYFPRHPDVYNSVAKGVYLSHNYDRSSAQSKVHGVLLKNMKASYNDMIDAEKASAFPAIVCEELKISGMNDSTHGASFGRIYQSTILSLTKLLKTLSPSDIFVVIMLTSPFRLLIPSSNTFIDIQVSWEGFLTKEEKYIRSFYIKNSPDQYFFLTAKAYIDALTSFLNDHQLNYTVLDSWLYSSALNSVNDDTVKVMPRFNEPIINWYIKSDKIFLPCGHFNQRTHKDIASWLITNHLVE
jgi:hypothetical protein